jgi:hypothetical protein
MLLLCGLLAPALTSFSEAQTLSFNETVALIDRKLSQVERNRKVGYRFTPIAICVAQWGNDSIRTVLTFSAIARVGLNTGSDASVVCPSEQRGRGRARPLGCISTQHHGEAGWVTHDTSSFARFSVGNDGDSAEVRLALARLIAMCGGGD